MKREIKTSWIFRTKYYFDDVEVTKSFFYSRLFFLSDDYFINGKRCTVDEILKF